MEVIENATQLKALLLECAQDPGRPGWLRCHVEVKQTDPVPNLPSLVHAAVGDNLSVLISPADQSQVEALKPGTEINLQVRRRAPDVHTAVPGSVTVE